MSCVLSVNQAPGISVWRSLVNASQAAWCWAMNTGLHAAPVASVWAEELTGAWSSFCGVLEVFLLALHKYEDSDPAAGLLPSYSILHLTRGTGPSPPGEMWEVEWRYNGLVLPYCSVGFVSLHLRLPFNACATTLTRRFTETPPGLDLWVICSSQAIPTNTHIEDQPDINRDDSWPESDIMTCDVKR